MLTLAILREQLGGLGISTTDDAVLTREEAWAHDRVERETRRSFRASTSLTEYYDGTGEQSLELRAPVVSGAPTVSVLFGGTWTTLLSDSGVVVLPHRELRISNILFLPYALWPASPQSVKVTYTGGYGANAEPDEIRSLVGELTCQRFRDRVVATPPDNEQRGEEGIPDHLQAILDRWTFRGGVQAMRLVRV